MLLELYNLFLAPDAHLMFNFASFYSNWQAEEIEQYVRFNVLNNYCMRLIPHSCERCSSCFSTVKDFYLNELCLVNRDKLVFADI